MSVPPPPPGTPPPPPPPPPSNGWGASSPAPVFRAGDAISYGWSAYWRNVGPMILVTLVIWIVNLIIGFIAGAVDNLTSQIVLNILSFVVGIVLAMGLIRAALAVVDGNVPDVRLLTNTEGFAGYLGASILVTIGVALGFVALIIPGIILAIMWQFFGYVIVENPMTGPVDAMRRSAEITKGHRWQLLGLGLLLLLINLVGVLACFVGVIFTYGITAIALAYTYKTLSGQRVASPN